MQKKGEKLSKEVQNPNDKNALFSFFFLRLKLKKETLEKAQLVQMSAPEHFNLF